MARHGWWGGVTILVILAGFANIARADEKEAVAALKAMKLDILHEDSDPKKPVVQVGFNFKCTDAQLKTAAGHLKQLPKLRRLDLSSTQITDAGLAHLKDLKSLEDLVLSVTKITDAGLVHLKGLTNLK